MTPGQEAALRAGRVDSPAQWHDVVTHLAKRLSTFLQLEVVAESMSELEPAAFSCGLHGTQTLGGALQLEWSGVLELKSIDGETQVSASLFLFSHRRRLQVVGQLGSSLQLLYEPRADGPGQWISLGWQEDVYGEYEEVEL